MNDSTTTCPHYVGCPHDGEGTAYSAVNHDGGRCPSCQVPFAEPPTSGDCPVPEQHASSFQVGDRVQLVDPAAYRVGYVVCVDGTSRVVVRFDDAVGTKILTDANLVHEKVSRLTRNFGVLLDGEDDSDKRVWLVEWETSGGEVRGQCGTAGWARRASDELIANATIVTVGAWPADEPPTACIDCGNEFDAPVDGDVLLEAAGVTTYAKGACGRCLPCTQGRRWNAEDAPRS